MKITFASQQEQQFKTTLSNCPDFKTLPEGAKMMLLFSEARFSDQPASPPNECPPPDAGPKRQLTFGDFVAGVYNIWGKRQAKGIVQLAVKMNVVEFRGPQRFVIS